ncbi:hypothetical protein V0R39_02320 [Pseudomonas inefficax]|nr:hypothetical protein [Pseudomonas inefficax]MEE1906667.1 hypothetical protein [Pseudomonas inefficax]MEE1983313.1 hypothetical protein [Pseudomonas inefficax]
MNLQLELMNTNISMLKEEIKYLEAKIKDSNQASYGEGYEHLIKQQENAIYYLQHATQTKEKIIKNTYGM